MIRSENLRLDKIKRALDLIHSRVVRAKAPADLIEIVDPAEATFAPPPATAAWRPFPLQGDWGSKQGWAWFRARLAVPRTWSPGGIELHLRPRAVYLEPPHDDNFPAGPEGQVFIDGMRVGAIDQQHFRIRHPVEPGQTVEATAVFFAGRCACRHALEAFELRWVDRPTERLHHDLRVALDVAMQIDPAAPAADRLIEAIDAAFKALEVRETYGDFLVAGKHRRDAAGATFYPSVARAQQVFGEALAQIAPAGETPAVLAVGHAHIDLAWLWPIRQTRHKCVRTFATQCRLLDEYPEWVYNQSSPQAYAWVAEDAPDLFERVRGQIRRGRWEADGAMWCESDTNIPSGESLVRQFLHGKRYFQETFGIDSRMLWLPDVFGYSAALPQIMRLCGVDGFITSKISWSQYNRFPHDTFRWRGLDGTEVPTHFITTPFPGNTFLTYNAEMTVAEVKSNWDEYRQRALGHPALMTFGHGDGGGGPTEEMLETATRLASMPPVAGMPRVVFGKASDSLRAIAARATELPVWDGELYLELHRGTYTTQAWIKRANRKSEIRMQQLEWLASLAAPEGHEFERERIDRLWRDLLLLQFHDILPGSSVGEVYETEARPMHARIATELDAMIGAASLHLAQQIDTSAFTRPIVLFNTLSWDRRDPVRLPDGTWRDDVVIPAGGWSVIDGAAAPSRDRAPLDIREDGRHLESQFWRIRIDGQGRIAELHDKRADRGVLPAGAAANEWQVFLDRPLAHDAWDVDLHYQDHPLPGPALRSIRVAEQGPVRAAVEFVWEMPALGEGPRSVLTQRLAIYAEHPRIDFETAIDWHEHHQLLKVAFPVDVRAREATYQIQFGHVRRPTHRNTSWDLAQFEVCAHQFADLAEHGYGLALLNDCKYGHDAHDGVLRLTCIKSPQCPDARADQGRHEFTYSLLPHSGSFQEASIIRAAAELNSPPVPLAASRHGGSLPPAWRFVTCDHPAVAIVALKPAEDGCGQILRLFESHGAHARARLTFSHSFRRVSTVDLLERPLPLDGFAHAGESVSLNLRPFQIITLRLER